MTCVYHRTSAVVAVGLGLLPNLAAADMICETRIVCSEAFDCSEAERHGSMLSRIVLPADGATAVFAPDGTEADNAMLFQATGTVSETRHFIASDPDGTAMLLTLFEDGTVFLTNHGPVLGVPFLGSAFGNCREDG